MISTERKKPRRKSPLNRLKLVERKEKFKVMYRRMQQARFSEKNQKARGLPPAPKAG